MAKKPAARRVLPLTVSATDGAKRFARMVDRVRESAASYVITRGGVPVAEIGPVKSRRFTADDFANLVQCLPATDGAFADAVRDGLAKTNRPKVPKSPWAR